MTWLATRVRRVCPYEHMLILLFRLRSDVPWLDHISDACKARYHANVLPPR